MTNMITDRDSYQCLLGKIEKFTHCKSLATYFETHCFSQSNDDDTNNRIAAIHNDSFLTFDSLNQRANIVARNILQEYNNNRNLNWQYVGIMLEEGFERLTTILACLKLGLAVVPLVLNRNVEQIRHIINEVQLSIIIHKSCLLVDSSEINVIMLPIDKLQDNFNNNVDDVNLLHDECIIKPKLDNPVVLLNTSGSSGIPKLIVLNNQQLFNRLFWQWRYLPFRADEIVCHRTGFMFVDNFVECLSCILSSITMVIVSPMDSCDFRKLTELINKYHITWILTVPSLLQKWLNQIDNSSQSKEALATLFTVVSSGEMLMPDLAKRFFNCLTSERCRLVNLYGSTEVCGDVSCEIFHDIHSVIDKSKNGFLSVGRPVSNNKIIVLSNSNGEGEVVVVGANVSSSCGKVYQTGDVGYIDGNNLYICGRVDDMVKINGKKFFTKDISAAVLCHSDVDNCYTIQLMLKGKSFLVSFFTTKTKTLNINNIKTEITNHLMKNGCNTCLPRLEHITNIPFQASSMKPDKRALCALASKIIYCEIGIKPKGFCRQEKLSEFPNEFPFSELKENSLKNSNLQRKCILEILAKHLGLSPDDLFDSMNFYNIGGDSITMIICISDLNRKGFSCKTDVFFYSPYIGEIVNNIIEQSNSTIPRISDKQIDTGDIKNNFIIENIEYESKNDVIQFLIDNFYAKEIVLRSLHTPVEVFVNVVSEIFDMAIRSECSFSVKDLSSQRIVAIQLSKDNSYDMSHLDQFQSIDYENVLEYFLESCKPRLPIFINTPKLNVAVIAISAALASPTIIQLLYFIERHTIELASLKGFKTIETVNTSEVTKKICSELNYKIIKTTSLIHFLQRFLPQLLNSYNVPDAFGHYMIKDLMETA